MSHSEGISSYRGLVVFLTRRGNVNIVGVDGDIVMERSKKEGVEQFLGNAGGSGRHCILEGLHFDNGPFIIFAVWAFIGACLGDSCRNLRSGLERTSPTPKPKSLWKGESPSIVLGIASLGVVHGIKI